MKPAARAVAGAAFLTALALLCVPRVITADGEMRWRAVDQLLQGLSLEGIRYSLIGPLFASPLIFLDHALGEGRTLASYYNVLLFLGAALALVIMLRPFLGREVALRFGLLLGLGSMIPFHTTNFYGETFTAVGLALGSVALLRGWEILGAIVLSLAAANTPATGVALGAMILVLAWRERKPLWLAIPLLAAILVISESRLQRGEFFVSGYEGSRGPPTVLPFTSVTGFSYPFALGALSLLFSFGKGLCFFSPGLLAPAFADLFVAPGEDRSRTLFWAWFAAVGGLILVYGKWWDWSGDQYWGPRFLLFASFPASLALAGLLGQMRSLRARIATGGALLLSAWVGFDGLVFGNHDMAICYQLGKPYLCWYTPDFSALARPFVSPRPLGGKELLIAAIWLFGTATLAIPLWHKSRDPVHVKK